jgi:hypothetical protein
MTTLGIWLSHSSAFAFIKLAAITSGDSMFQEDHKRLMSEARAISNAARAALWRALVTAREIEKLVGPCASKNEITRGNAKGSGSE